MRILPILAVIISMAACAHGASIDQLIVNPQEAWLGDAVTVTSRCTDTVPITSITADIIGPGFLLPSLSLAAQGDSMYQIKMPGSYFDRRGTFTAGVTCNGNGSAYGAVEFNISQFTMDISSPQSVYTGGQIELDLNPQKNGANITSGVSISVVFNGTQAQLDMPPFYDSIKGMVVKLHAPQAPGSYQISVLGTYQGKTITSTANIDVDAPVEFSIPSSTQSVKPYDNITFNLIAKNRGSQLPLDASTLDILVNGVSPNINSVDWNGGSYDVSIVAPDLPPGNYQIEVRQDFNGTTYYANRTIDYTTTLSGRFTDINGKPITAQIMLFNSGSEKYSINTLSDGTYSADVIPGTYDVEIWTPDAQINLQNANVNSFTDPVTYAYDPGARIDGFMVSGVYTIKTSWSFDRADVTLGYDDTLFDNVMNLSVYNCPYWSQGRCTSNWLRIAPDYNPGQHRVSFSTSNLGVFAVGQDDQLSISMSLDKNKYARGDIASLKGSVSGQQGLAGNVSLRIFVNGYLDKQITANENGVFGLDFVAPDQEGNFTLRAAATKYPYQPGQADINMEVVSMPSASIIFPASIQVKEGGNDTEDIDVVNTGQGDLHNAMVALDLDKKYYELGQYDTIIPEGKDIHIPIMFKAGVNESQDTLSGTIKLSSDETSQQKVFGFTILPPDAAKPSSATGLAIALPSLPEIDPNIWYVLIIAIACFASAFLAKKMKKSANTSSRILMPQPVFVKQNPRISSQGAYLADVKRYLDSKEAGP